MNPELPMTPEISIRHVSNNVRASAREDVVEGLDLIARFVGGMLPSHEFVDRFGAFFYDRALDGHEDAEGAVEHSTLRSTLALRLLQDVQSVIDRLFDETTEVNPQAYLAQGRIPFSQVETEVVKAIALSTVRLALDTIVSE